jgi:hypothetical protein
MKWRYGIVKYRHKTNPEYRYYGIGEVYFNEDPNLPFAVSEDPINLIIDELDLSEGESDVCKLHSNDLDRISKDIKKYPIFDIDGPYEK